MADDPKPADKKSSSKTTSKTSGDKKHKPKHTDKKSSSSKTSDKKSSSKTGGDVPTVLKKEFNEWKKAKKSGIKWLEITPVDLVIKLSFTNGDTFNITYSATYPQGDNFFVLGESDGMDAWTDAVGLACEQRLTLSQLLDVCVKNRPAEDVAEIDDDLDAGNDSGDDWLDSKKASNVGQAEDNSIKANQFLQIGSPGATLRLLQDLKNIKKLQSAGFEAFPVVEPGTKAYSNTARGSSHPLRPNLYRWEVHLTDFPEPIAGQLETYAKSRNVKKSIQLEMRFSDKYPNIPPFVRVIRPRFAAMTGHITIGGSICMELLTMAGWAAVNDIESILIQIKTEMTEGGARLDVSSHDYNEQEAWEAFYRAAKKHNWSVDGLSAKMFPKV